MTCLNQPLANQYLNNLNVSTYHHKGKASSPYSYGFLNRINLANNKQFSVLNKSNLFTPWSLFSSSTDFFIISEIHHKKIENAMHMTENTITGTKFKTGTETWKKVAGK